jgi:hypothetical protein
VARALGPGLAVAAGLLFGAAMLNRRPRARFSSPLSRAVTPRARVIDLANAYLSLWTNADPDTRKAITESIWENAVGTSWKGEPWSAAFVTHVVNTAYPGALYPSAKHSIYTAEALEGFGHYHVVPVGSLIEPLRPGDLLLKPRAGAPAPSWDEVAEGNYLSHADIVTEVGPDFVQAIGGNKLGGGIARERYPLGPDGRPLLPVFAVLLLDDQADILTAGPERV